MSARRGGCRALFAVAAIAALAALGACGAPRAARVAPVGERAVGATPPPARAAGGAPVTLTAAPRQVAALPTPLPAVAAVGAAPRSSAGGAGYAANPAVVALLGAASHAARAGRHERAAAALERGLAIEPRNPWLWSRLATVRFRQGRMAQAEVLAARSNGFAGSDLTLRAENLRLIARARAAQRRRVQRPGTALPESR